MVQKEGELTPFFKITQCHDYIVFGVYFQNNSLHCQYYFYRLKQVAKIGKIMLLRKWNYAIVGDRKTWPIQNNPLNDRQFILNFTLQNIN